MAQSGVRVTPTFHPLACTVILPSVLSSCISTDRGTCGSNRFPGVIFPLYAHEDRASQ